MGWTKRRAPWACLLVLASLHFFSPRPPAAACYDLSFSLPNAATLSVRVGVTEGRRRRRGIALGSRASAPAYRRQASETKHPLLLPFSHNPFT